MGIAPERVTLLRELPWHSTRLGHRVKPFLARVAPGPYQANPQEVERLIFLPRESLRQELFQVRGTWEDSQGAIHTTYTFRHDGLEVWGLTARILRDCL